MRTVTSLAAAVMTFAVLLLVAVSPASAAHPDAGDIAPGTIDNSTSPPTYIVQGDDDITVSDVVVLLRASVGLIQLSDPVLDDAVEAQIAVDALEARVAQLEALLANITRTGNDITISGANLHLVNGSGATSTVNGLGNLVIGYNEPRGFVNLRTGSHVLVLGARNNFTSYAGIVAGESNEVSAPWTSVLGGTQNVASVLGGMVLGGEGNTASGAYSAVTGGFGGLASGQHSVVAGGNGNEASGVGAAVLGGVGNLASGEESTVSGGVANEAAGSASAVAGGEIRTAPGESDTRVGSILEDQ